MFPPDEGSAADPGLQERRPRQAPGRCIAVRRRRRHGAGTTGGVVVSAKTAYRGIERRTVPVAPLSRRPTSRFSPIPSAFHRRSRKDVLGGSPPIA
jgi:hypothetical protein